MKIAIFSDTFLPEVNGVASVVFQSAKILHDLLGYEVMVVTVSPKNKKDKVDVIDGVKIVTFPSIPAMVYPERRLSLPTGLSYKKIKKFNPDVIHTHTPFGIGWEAVAMAKLLNIPIAGTHHTFFDDYLKHAKLDFDWMKKASWKYTKAYYNNCDIVLIPSKSLADSLKKYGVKKTIEIVPNSINTKLFTPVSGNTEKNNLKKSFGINGQSLIYMGRLSYEKSVEQIIKAFPLMLKEKPELKLMIVGDGPDRKKLEKMARELKVYDKIIFTGYLYGEKLADSLKANDLFITASKSENMPVSVLEAMSAGLPVVTVKEKGLAEIIFDGENGFFAKTDNPEDIAKKVLSILSDKILLEKFSKKSRELALQYSEKNVAEILDKNYKKILRK